MRTTPRSSDLSRFLGLVCCAFLACALLACAEPWKAADFFVLEPVSPQYRAAQTRFFETSDEIELLSASAAVLQDLGFQLEESVRDVGLLRATKERSAREYGQEINRFLLALIGAGQIPVDLQQRVSATLLTRTTDDPARREVRVTFYRIVWQGDGQRSRGDGTQEYIPPGQQRMQMIRTPEIYQQFFMRLSKAVFLEAHRI